MLRLHEHGGVSVLSEITGRIPGLQLLGVHDWHEVLLIAPIGCTDVRATRDIGDTGERSCGAVEVERVPERHYGRVTPEYPLIAGMDGQALQAMLASVWAEDALVQRAIATLGTRLGPVVRGYLALSDERPWRLTLRELLRRLHWPLSPQEHRDARANAEGLVLAAQLAQALRTGVPDAELCVFHGIGHHIHRQVSARHAIH